MWKLLFWALGFLLLIAGFLLMYQIDHRIPPAMSMVLVGYTLMDFFYDRTNHL